LLVQIFQFAGWSEHRVRGARCAASPLRSKRLSEGIGELSAVDLQGAFRLRLAPYLLRAEFCGVSIQVYSIVSLQVFAGRFHVTRKRCEAGLGRVCPTTPCLKSQAPYNTAVSGLVVKCGQKDEPVEHVMIAPPSLNRAGRSEGQRW